MKYPPKKTLFVFIDEGGDLTFSNKGTEYFTLTALSMIRPFKTQDKFANLKYDLWEKGIEFEYFHATEDTQHTRNEVFQIISENIFQFIADTVIVKKRKTHPRMQDPLLFYKKNFEILLNYTLTRNKGKFDNVIVITDTIPINKNRKRVEKAVKGFFKRWSMMNKETQYEIFHYASKSDIYLQVVDYFNWAIFRRWERGDERSYAIIKAAIFSEFDVFEQGSGDFY